MSIPRLKYPIYSSSRGLIENGILTKDESEDLSRTQERVRLVLAAIQPIEDLIINGRIQRDSVLLDLTNVDASGMGGTGAQPL